MSVNKSSATLAMGFGERRLPYLYSDPMDEACRSIATKGFDAVELLVPSPDFISSAEISRHVAEHRLEVSAIGTGGAYITRRLQLCSPDASVRDAAEEFVRGIIRLAAPFGATVILGLVTGFLEAGVTRPMALDWLAPALNRLGAHASEHGITIVIEPLNRYESNLINRLEDGLELIPMLDFSSVKLLADFFHMNIEEASIEESIRRAGRAIGHVHFVDSNRCAPGMGHLDFAQTVRALKEIDYAGFISVEALPHPDSETAADNAISAYRQWFGK